MSNSPSTTASALWLADPFDARVIPADELCLSRRSRWILIAFGLSLLLIGLGTSRVLTYHEAVYAQSGKEMLLTGDWLIPRIGGVPFLDKPPGTAWAIATAMGVLGTENEWAARLPSALAGVVTALLIAALAARWYGDRMGLITGLAQLTSMHLLMQARLAEPDMLFAAVVTGACCTFAWGNLDGPQGRSRARWLPWLFYFLAGCAFIVKSLPGPVFIFGGCGLYTLVARDWRALRWLISPIGWLAFAAATLPWIVGACLRHPPVADALILYNFGYYGGAWGQNENRFAYFYLVPMLMLPWGAFLPTTLWAGIRKGHWRDRRWWFLLCWFAGGMCVLSTAAFKSKHYAIPLLPPLVLLSTLGLAHFVTARYRLRNPRSGWLAALGLVGVAIGVAAVEKWCTRDTHETAAIVAAMGLGGAIVFYLESRRKLGLQLAALFGLCWAIAVAVQLFIIPAHDTYLPQAEMARRVNAAVGPDEPIYLLDLPSNQVTFYLTSPVVRLDEPATQFPDERAAKQGAYALMPRFLADKYVAAGEADLIERCAFLNRYLGENERLTFVRWHGGNAHTAAKHPDAKR